MFYELNKILELLKLIIEKQNIIEISEIDINEYSEFINRYQFVEEDIKRIISNLEENVALTAVTEIKQDLIKLYLVLRKSELVVDETLEIMKKIMGHYN